MTQKCLNGTLAVDSHFYRLLALPLCSRIAFLIELRIILYNAHLALFMTQLHLHKPIGKYRHLANFDFGTSLGSKSTTAAVCRPDEHKNSCRLGIWNYKNYYQQGCIQGVAKWGIPLPHLGTGLPHLGFRLALNHFFIIFIIYKSPKRLKQCPMNN